MKNIISKRIFILGLHFLLLFSLHNANSQDLPTDTTNASIDNGVLTTDSLAGFHHFWQKADTLILLIAQRLNQELVTDFKPDPVIYNIDLKGNDLVDNLKGFLTAQGASNSPLFSLIDSLEFYKSDYRKGRSDSQISNENYATYIGKLFEDAERLIDQTFPNEDASLVLSEIRSNDAFKNLNIPQKERTSIYDSVGSTQNKATRGIFITQNIIPVLGLFLMLILFYLFFRMNSRIRDLNNDLRIWKDKNNNNLGDLRNKIGAIKTNNDSKFSSLEHQLSSLSENLALTNNELIELRNNKPDPLIKPEAKPIQQEPSEKNKNIFFLPNADPGGFFWDDKKTSLQENGSIFLLEVDPSNPGYATFKLLIENEKVVKNAVTNPSYLKPVCQIENIDSGGRNISVIKPGILRLNQDKWVIADGNKLIIKFY